MHYTMKTSRLTALAVLALLVATVSLQAADPKPPAKKKRKPRRAPVIVKTDNDVVFTLYTVHNGVLKITAQMQPDCDTDKKVRLEVQRGGTWKQVAQADIIKEGWTAPLRVENWGASRDTPFRVLHGDKSSWSGTIKADPVDKDTIVVMAFTGNSPHAGHGANQPKTDIFKAFEAVKPDLVFFSGDQVYDHRHHTHAWIQFGRTYGKMLASVPTVTIPDDHDVGQANIWGAGGKKSNTGAGHDGGYFMPVDYVKMVERAQTSHLPDPYDPTPIQRGIGVYYTSMPLGGISFAIIEDRKFKSGPQGLVPKQGPRPDHIRNPEYDPKSVDVPKAVLLGKRQLAFLKHWAADWKGAEMKVVLSQTVFANLAHIHGSRNNRLHADMDSNGWPQTGRNKALAEIRKGFAFMLCGDQHLATVAHHGIDDWGDSGYSFCVPSIANLYLRWWLPTEPAGNHIEGQPAYAGQFKDGFGNKVTMLAAGNPGTLLKDGKATKNPLIDRSAGYGIVKFNRTTRKITMECWPRLVDITDPKTKQFPGWPVTIDQADNYGRKATAYLPTLRVSGKADPVVQVIDESDGEIVYTLRIKGSTFRPKVFKAGVYTIKVGPQDSPKVIKGVKSTGLTESKTLKVTL